MAKLKVFGGHVNLCSNQSGYGVVATTSQKKLAEILGVSVGYVRDYWAVTGNKKDIEHATANPETLFIQYPSYKGDYLSLEEAKEKATAVVEKYREEQRKRLEAKKNK